MLFGGFELGLSLVLLAWLGVIGVALAYPIANFLHILGMLWVGKSLISYRITSVLVVMFLVSSVFIGITLVSYFVLPDIPHFIAAFCVTGLSAVYAMKGLSRRLGGEHRLVKLAMKIPFANHLLK